MVDDVLLVLEEVVVTGEEVGNISTLLFPPSPTHTLPEESKAKLVGLNRLEAVVTLAPTLVVKLD